MLMLNVASTAVSTSNEMLYMQNRRYILYSCYLCRCCKNTNYGVVCRLPAKVGITFRDSAHGIIYVMATETFMQSSDYTT